MTAFALTLSLQRPFSQRHLKQAPLSSQTCKYPASCRCGRSPSIKRTLRMGS